MHVELQATCSALGYQEGNQYIREPDCLETVKDLIRFLKREDEFCDIRRQLGHAQIVKNDLIPLVKQYKSEPVLWETVIRLLVNLTQPAVLCFNGFIPEVKSLRQSYLDVVSHLQSMKEAFIDEELFSVITDKLGELLKLDWEHRQEEDRLLIERLLIVIRNVLHVPTDPEAEQRTDDDASIHDQVLWAMHVSGLEDILLYIASSEEERNLSMHILEIISLMFREQTPEMLASAGVQRSLTEKEKDERELEMVREQERLQKKANVMKYSTRHSRFGGTYVVKNMKSISENDVIYHKSQATDASKITLDMNKKPKKKAKNRKPIIEKDLVRRSTLSIRLSLKEFCVQFLENCYNPLMYAVKDILNREKSQEHDETYYLWALKFFMEFCRLHFKQVDLIGETMSVPIFHYIQVQLYEYYEMQTMEKKEAIVWGNRIHLALKAYQELLMTLDSMDKSGNSTLMESSKVIKSNIFYMMEFRDIFLTLLRHFNQSRQSRTYLKDLIETTHLFLKMLENFSKKTHLVVQKKKKKTGRKKKPRNNVATAAENTEPTEQELEDLWDEVSSELSAIFQGRSEIPTDVTPFDAASEVDVDEQRADAMIRIQDSLRGRKSGEAVALFRAAREVWPERNEFGTPDISPEDEFMALREIFMTALPRRQPDIPETMEEPEIEDEVEEEELSSVVTSEQEFVFQEYAVKFAKPDVLKAYVLLIADFQKNSTHTNHCCVKMLHRVAVDLGCVGMVFQASLFRIFQKILLSPLAKSERYKELAKFATYIVRRFVETAQNNPKVFMELLFWKTNKEAVEVVDGYGSYQGKGKVAWSEDSELEVRRLFDEYREETEKDTVDCIMERITDPSKTRGQIIRELKRQELIESAKDLKKPKQGVRAGPWREEHEMELRELFDRFKHSNDPVGEILANMTTKRSKAKVMEKILSLGLVEDRKDLYKRRGSKAARRSRRGRGGDSSDDDLQALPSDYEDEPDLPDMEGRERPASGASDGGSSSSSSDSDNDSDTEDRPGQSGSQGDGELSTMADVIKDIVAKGYKDQIAWIQRCLTNTAEDREEDAGQGQFVGVPIVPLSEENETAMEDEVFLSFLIKIGLAAPADEQEAFWRIPPNLSALDLRNIVSGLALDENNVPFAAYKIKMKSSAPKPKQKEKKRKKEKKRDNDRKKKNAGKFAALRELVKKKADAKKTKRTRKVVKPVSNRDESSDDEPLTRLSEPSTEQSVTESQQSPRISSAKKKRRVRSFARSDSDDSDNGDRLRIAENDGESESESRTQSTQGDESQGQSSQGSRSQSQEPESQPLLFLPSSDEEENESQKVGQEDREGESQSSKRSRSSGSDSDSGNQQVKKKARIVDSDSDDETPQAAAATESFPATLYTQGPESDSDLDDHVPLRRVIQKKNMIESDDED